MRRLFVMFAMAFVLAGLVAMPPAVAAQEKASKPRESSAAAGPLNLNTATAAQLEKLPGIGARTAQLIVEHRQKNGGFKKVEETLLLRIAAAILTCERSRPDGFGTGRGWDGSSRQWSSTQRGFSVRFLFSSPSRSMGQSDHSRTPVLLTFLVRLPSVTATGRWRERGRMQRR